MTNDAAAISELLQRIRKQWTPFPFGSSQGLYKGTVRAFRKMARTVLATYPRSLPFELNAAQEELEERGLRISELELEIDALKELITDKDSEHEALVAQCEAKGAKIEAELLGEVGSLEFQLEQLQHLEEEADELRQRVDELLEL